VCGIDGGSGGAGSRRALQGETRLTPRRRLPLTALCADPGPVLQAAGPRVLQQAVAPPRASRILSSAFVPAMLLTAWLLTAWLFPANAAERTRPVTPGAASCSAGLRPLEGHLEFAGRGRGDLVVQTQGQAAVPVRLAGLRLQEDDDPSALADVAAEWLSLPATRLLAAGPADRWGRVPILLISLREAGEDSLNAALARAGIGRFRSGDVGFSCARLLQAAEDTAREAGRGLWAHAGIADGARPETLAAREGLFTLVEGRVVGLGETKTRIYLNFGTVRSEDFTVSILKRNLRKFEASGMRWTSWEGRRIRVRGIVVPAGGPLIEVSSPEDVERLD
jgi:hypothetical protein